MLKRRSPSEATRRQAIHYAKKAVALMEAGSSLSTVSTSERSANSFARWTAAPPKFAMSTARCRDTAVGWSRKA